METYSAGRQGALAIAEHVRRCAFALVADFRVGWVALEAARIADGALRRGEFRLVALLLVQRQVDQELQYGVDEGTAKLVDESIDMCVETELDGEQGETETEVNAEKILEGNAEDFAVAEDGIGVDARANIEEGVTCVKVVELTGTDDRGGATVEFSVRVSGGGPGPTSEDVAVWPGEDGAGGSQKSDEDGRETHVGFCVFFWGKTGSRGLGCVLWRGGFYRIWADGGDLDGDIWRA